MEWQISVWLEFAQEEGCIRVKKKIKQGREDKTKTTLISQSDQDYNVFPRKKKCRALAFCRKFKKYFGEYDDLCSFKGNFHKMKKQSNQ